MNTTELVELFNDYLDREYEDSLGLGETRPSMHFKYVHPEEYDRELELFIERYVEDE